MIALIDCNNFYCSCERVFQPHLVGKPLIVLSNNDGCAISISEEAKVLGIKLGTPLFMVEKLIKENNVSVYSSNYTLYGDMSKRVMTTIEQLAPKTEVYSIDEIFADLSNMPGTDLNKLALSIKDAVYAHTGIPVCIGVAATKTLAKMANRYAKKKKKEGVFVANNPEAVNEMLTWTQVGDIWGVGRQYETLLLKNGFKTAYDLITHAPENWIKEKMSVVGQRLYNELKGISAIEWAEQGKARKNICTSRSFGSLITTKKEIKQAVAKFTSSCAEKMRTEQTCARKVQVFIQTNPHRLQDKQYHNSITLEFAVATNLTNELLEATMRGVDMIFKEGYNYKKAGVVVHELIPEQQIQLGLFDNKDRIKDKRLMQSLDLVNNFFGKDAVRFGVQGYTKNWHLKRGYLSPAYTTRLSDIPRVY